MCFEDTGNMGTLAAPSNTPTGRPAPPMTEPMFFVVASASALGPIFGGLLLLTRSIWNGSDRLRTYGSKRSSRTHRVQTREPGPESPAWSSVLICDTELEPPPHPGASCGSLRARQPFCCS